MKFFFQFLGNVFCFFLYTIIGLQVAEPGNMDFTQIETLSWPALFQTILFFIIIASLSIMTTYSFTYAFQKRNSKKMHASKVEGHDFSPEVIVEDREEKPERIIDILTDSTNKVIRENSQTEKTPKHRKKKAGKKKITKSKK